MQATFDARVLSKEKVARNVVSFRFGSLDGSPLPPFSAGAHIDVHIPGGFVRQYSLCSSPEDGGDYRIAVLRDTMSRGGSNAMHDTVRVGDALRLSEPRNLFPLEHLELRPLLIAGGIGITPILCMAERLATLQYAFDLFYTARSRDNAAFVDRISQASFAGCVRMHFKDEPGATALDLEKVFGEAHREQPVYVCGPPRLLQAVRDTAARFHWGTDHIHSESFVNLALGSETSQVFSIKLASSGRTFTIPPDRSVIEVLRESGVVVPVSCEQGVCGTCLTRILAGVPDHRDLILSDEEKAANDQFTPCCSRSLTPELVLDL